MNEVEEQRKMLNERFPLSPHTNAGRLTSTVRRMKAEKELGLPVHLRTGFAISVADSKPANELDEDAWERFFQQLCGELKGQYPEMHSKIFESES
jgi:hypothetical protein